VVFLCHNDVVIPLPLEFWRRKEVTWGKNSPAVFDQKFLQKETMVSWSIVVVQ
jgi:hypothetical protein